MVEYAWDLPAVEVDDWEPLQTVKITNSGKSYLVYAKTEDDIIDLDKGHELKRCPFINSAYLFSAAATWSNSEEKVLILDWHSYKSLFGLNEMPSGVHVVVYGADSATEDTDINIMSDIEEIKRHMRVSQAIGWDVFINGSKDFMEEFLWKVDGEIVLITHQKEADVIRKGEYPIRFIHDRPHEGSTLVDKVRLQNISQKSCTLVYNNFVST